MTRLSSLGREKASSDRGILLSAFEQTADHVVITNIEGLILYVNPAFEKTTGFTSKEAIGQTPRILKSGEHNQAFYAGLWNTILAGNTYQGALINKKKNGDLYYADQIITPIQDRSGQITNFISIWQDITGRMRAHEQLNRSNADLMIEKQKLEKILQFGEQIEYITNFNQLIDFIIEQASSILEAERCSLMLFDEESGELCIKGAKGLKSDIIKKSRLTVGEGIAGAVAREGRPLLVKFFDTDSRIHHKQLPTCKTKSFLSVPIRLEHKLIGIINVTDKKSKDCPVFNELDLKILSSIVRQVAIAIENAQLSKEIKYLTIQDPLTSLYNHRYLMECLSYEIRRFKRFGRPLSLLIMDVDNFKNYNDVFGNFRGNLLLKQISSVLTGNLREVDVVCRYAGDEFAAILPETSLEEAHLIAEKIRWSVSQMNAQTPVTLSMGIASCCEQMTRHDFVLKASAALHKAKEDGKNRTFCQLKTGSIRYGHY